MIFAICEKECVSNSIRVEVALCDTDRLTYIDGQ
jgi:hypothetical protein